jgi:hypothetical protein
MRIQTGGRNPWKREQTTVENSPSKADHNSHIAEQLFLPWKEIWQANKSSYSWQKSGFVQTEFYKSQEKEF